ncbi:MAG: DUF3343 domain-containing protein [Candidatus Cloacimonetes bacterium]|nr:DUF3343 domain-containing protein [Candidatus Cloacimonadota bacterium]MCF7815095.1 DUF3343 domain-containing protein [Candidatus Cloacimonadota bacterium]MCF7869319.1 DUF3343 domain-containing protein [Candidatus Cloacimonadota bacterium]MCF7884729.1 DUF3343 domain-containing protein [Candidatus Cloacimonadota bacterium]
MNKSVILFHSTNYAIWAENELKEKNLFSKLISVPRHLSSDCGYCVEIEASDKEMVEKILNTKNIDFEKIVDL